MGIDCSWRGLGLSLRPLSSSIVLSSALAKDRNMAVKGLHLSVVSPRQARRRLGG